MSLAAFFENDWVKYVSLIFVHQTKMRKHHYIPEHLHKSTSKFLHNGNTDLITETGFFFFLSLCIITVAIMISFGMQKNIITSVQFPQQFEVCLFLF